MQIKVRETGDIKEQVYKENNKRWFVSRLIEKSSELEVQVAPIGAINTYRLKPGMDTMGEFVDHIKRVQRADLTIPIILDEEGYIMDGRHRIARAILEGAETIKFVRFDETPPCDYTVEDTKA